MLNINQIRQDFPLICQSSQASTPVAYLDNAATTQKPRTVIQRLQEYYETGNANIHRGIYALAQKATQDYENARQQVQAFINASTSSEIIFTRGTTESINLVAQCFLALHLKTGDEVVVTGMEHHSNLVPWQVLCKKHGAVLRIVPVNGAGEVILPAYEQLLTKKTRLVALVHTSNSLGTINPVEVMTKMAKQQNIPVLIDGAQSVAHQAIDVQALDCDFFAFSGHKMYAPTGIGVLYAKVAHLETMTPYQYGGEMIRTVSYENSTFNRIPHKFEAGTPHIAGAIALSSAIDYIQQLGLSDIQDHLDNLLRYATQQLQTIDGLKIIGTAQHKTSIISFLLNDIHPHDMGTILNESGVAIRAGHHCTMPLMRHFDIPGTTRASFAVYNTLEEIDQLVAAIKKAYNIFLT